MMFMSFNSNKTGVTSGTRTALHSGTPDFTPAFCPFLLSIALSVLLRFAAFDYPCCIFKHFLIKETVYVSVDLISLRSYIQYYRPVKNIIISLWYFQFLKSLKIN